MGGKKLASAISYIFFPHVNLLVLVASYAAAFGLNKPLESAAGFAAFYFLIPLAYLAKYGRNIDTMSGRERGRIIAFGAVTYLLAPAYFVAIRDISALKLSLFLLAFVALFGSLTPLMKPSFHMGSFVATYLFVGLLFRPALTVLFLSPLIAWSRIKLGAHTKIQLAVGGILGAVLSVAFYLLL